MSNDMASEKDRLFTKKRAHPELKKKSIKGRSLARCGGKTRGNLKNEIWGEEFFEKLKKKI